MHSFDASELFIKSFCIFNEYQWKEKTNEKHPHTNWWINNWLVLNLVQHVFATIIHLLFLCLIVRFIYFVFYWKIPKDARLITLRLCFYILLHENQHFVFLNNLRIILLFLYNFRTYFVAFYAIFCIFLYHFTQRLKFEYLGKTWYAPIIRRLYHEQSKYLY